MENNHSTSRKLSMGIIAAITWFALLLQLKLSLGTTGTTGFSTVKTITNFFSYFTILSNLLVAISLSSALLFSSGKLGRFFTKISVQSAIAVYIFIVGLVYNLVLRQIWSPTGWQLVADNLLHVAVPILYVLYWVLYTPAKKLYWKDILPWLIFPALYLAYSLLRGPVANWYPYPFVDVATYGYEKVVLNSMLVLAVIVVTGLAAIAINRRGK